MIIDHIHVSDYTEQGRNVKVERLSARHGQAIRCLGHDQLVFVPGGGTFFTRVSNAWCFVVRYSCWLFTEQSR
jgi:hypothetical protein